MTFTVTLAELRKAGACTDGYNKLVHGLQGKEFTNKDGERETHIRFAHKEPISIEFIENNNGLNDALWSLKCIKNEDRSLRLYAVWCARQVEHLMTDQRSKDCLDVAEAFANGDASQEQLAAHGQKMISGDSGSLINPIKKAVGNILIEASKKDQIGRNALMFTLTQSPAYRETLMSIFPDVSNE